MPANNQDEPDRNQHGCDEVLDDLRFADARFRVNKDNDAKNEQSGPDEIADDGIRLVFVHVPDHTPDGLGRASGKRVGLHGDGNVAARPVIGE
jgi:hypothetical protein